MTPSNNARPKSQYTVFLCRLDSGNSSCSCPSVFSRCAGRCWLPLGEVPNVSEALQACADLEVAAHLATPRSAEENQCVALLAFGTSVLVALGFSGGPTVESLVGEDGCGPPEYTNWDVDAGEPQFSDSPSCVFMSADTRLWYDAGCAGSTQFICQLEHCYRPEC